MSRRKLRVVLQESGIQKKDNWVLKRNVLKNLNWSSGQKSTLEYRIVIFFDMVPGSCEPCIKSDLNEWTKNKSKQVGNFFKVRAISPLPPINSKGMKYDICCC